jgi:anti-anti-sigma factor
MDVAFDNSSGTFILRVSGDMRLWSREEGNERLVDLLRAREYLPKRMILNLAQVEHIDSLGVGALSRVLVECGKQEIDLKVVMPAAMAGKVLKAVHIFDACTAFPDEAAAVRASLETSAE